ncbi:hypothetical protein CsSME_00036269 [Camellia sinensis var. sinensis]
MCQCWHAYDMSNIGNSYESELEQVEIELACRSPSHSGCSLGHKLRTKQYQLQPRPCLTYVT